MFKKAIFVFFGFTPTYAGQDAEDSEDHPVIPRYEGSYIIGYEHIDNDRLVFPADLEG